MYVSSHLHALADLLQGKEPTCPLYGKLREPSNRSGGENQEFEDSAVTRNIVVWWWLMHHSTCNWFFVYVNFSNGDAIHNKIQRGDLFCKVKVIPQQAEVAEWVPGRLRPRIFLTFGTTRVVGRQPYAPAAFTQGEIPGTHFQRLSRPQATWFLRAEPRKKSPVTPPGIDPGTVPLVSQWDLFCSGWKYEFRRKFSDILKVMRRYSPRQAGDKYGRRCLFVPTELLRTNNALLLHQPDRIYVDILEKTDCLLCTLALKVKRQWRHSHRFVWPRYKAVTSQPPVSVVTTLGIDVTVTSFHSHVWVWHT